MDEEPKANRVPLDVLVDKDQREQIRSLAEANYRTLSAQVRMALDEHLQRHRAETAAA